MDTVDDYAAKTGKDDGGCPVCALVPEVREDVEQARTTRKPPRTLPFLVSYLKDVMNVETTDEVLRAHFRRHLKRRDA